MKRISILISIILAILLLCIPTYAKDRNDLQKIYSDLTQYLYTPYFNHSEVFPEYEAELERTKQMLDNKNATAAEINQQYTVIRNTYSKLAKSVFDYSSLDLFVEHFNLLNINLFEETSWDSFYDLMEEIFDEVESPTLFKKGNSTKETYDQTVNDYIKGFSTQFQSLFNNLKLRDLSEGMTKELLESLLYYCILSSNEEFMSESPYWPDYVDAMETVTGCIEKNRPTQNEIDAAAARLLSSHKRLCEETFDSTTAQAELERYDRLSPDDYTEPSWERYQKNVKKLKEKTEEPLFFYSKSISNFEDFKKQINAYYGSLAAPCEEAYKNLVTKEKYGELFSLCSTYAGVSSSEGVVVKWKLLQEAVQQGKEIIGSVDSTGDDFDRAIANIKEAAENLIAAQKFLSEEQSGLVTQDLGTLQLIIISLVISLLLSASLACYVSYRHNGTLDWRR